MSYEMTVDFGSTSCWDHGVTQRTGGQVGLNSRSICHYTNVIVGNAWAAAGMLRVLMTMNHTTQGYQFIEQSANLTTWINEILESAWQYQVLGFNLRSWALNDVYIAGCQRDSIERAG